MVAELNMLKCYIGAIMLELWVAENFQSIQKQKVNYLYLSNIIKQLSAHNQFKTIFKLYLGIKPYYLLIDKLIF